MSGSDQDTSENSNFSSGTLGTPYSSPSQMVPHFSISSANRSEDVSMHGSPKLRIVNQPRDTRFRYSTERETGTHGSILGVMSGPDGARSFPTVELINYCGNARIKCTLVEKDSDSLHPHCLRRENTGNGDGPVSFDVPVDNNYTVCFPNLGIIHRRKKTISTWLYQNYPEDQRANLDDNELLDLCETKAKRIDLNNVRLMFSAHDKITDELICPPVYSRVIGNLKNVATNHLKIMHFVPISSKPKGGDDMIILTSKVLKSNIMVRFFQLNNDGEEIWEQPVKIMESNVHSQAAIFFKIPRYEDLDIATDVTVHFELVRPSDGKKSEPRDFKYRCSDYGYIRKKAKQMQTPLKYPRLDQSETKASKISKPVASIQVLENVLLQAPMPQNSAINLGPMIAPPPCSTTPAVSIDTQQEYVMHNTQDNSSGLCQNNEVPQQLCDPNNPALYSEQQYFVLTNTSGNDFTDQTNELHNVSTMSNTEMGSVIEEYDVIPRFLKKIVTTDVRLTVPTYREHETEEIILPTKQEDYMETTTEDAYMALDSFLNDEGFKNYVNELSAKWDANFMPDSGRGHDKASTSARRRPKVKRAITLLEEICDLFKTSPVEKKIDIREKINKLLGLRFARGDTILHIFLEQKPSSLESIVKIIDTVNLNHELDLSNENNQTILHLACATERPSIVTLLIEKGCNPMARDSEGNTAIHLAAMYQTCLEPLLEAIKKYRKDVNLNAYNVDKQTALHVAVLYGQPLSVWHLLVNGAEVTRRDFADRTPLHHAADIANFDIVQALLQYKSEVDAVDGRGFTALQIACSSEATEDSLKVIRLLLENGANPTTHKVGTPSVAVLGSQQKEIRAILEEFKVLPPGESEDDFESAEEGDSEEEISLLFDDLKLQKASATTE